MLPKFPEFKKLELSDKADIEAITNKYPPYSDFNFTSMWCWDTRGEMMVSELNNNLVVKFADYITGEPFYSFIGTNDTNDTVRQLIGLATTQGIKPRLK